MIFIFQIFQKPYFCVGVSVGWNKERDSRVSEFVFDSVEDVSGGIEDDCLKKRTNPEVNPRIKRIMTIPLNTQDFLV